MNKIDKFDKSKRTVFAVLILLYSFLLILNFLTRYLVDDYTYMLNFSTADKLSSLGEVFESMDAHYYKMNGRTFAHALVQIFMYLPKPVFNFVNSAVIILLIVIICKIGKRSTPISAFSIIMCALLIWMYLPVFGQTCLWLTGSCNYIWSCLVCILFLMPYGRYTYGDNVICGPVKTILFTAFSVVAGGYSENASAAAIGMAFLMMLYSWVIQKNKFSKQLFVSWIGTLAGFLYMSMSPAGASAKIAGLDHLLKGIQMAAEKFVSLWPLLAAYVVMLIIAVTRKYDKRAIAISIWFFLGSVAANFIMSFANYYEDRSMCSVCIYLIAAVMVLFCQRGPMNGAALAICLAGILVCIPAILNGAKSVYYSYNECMKNEAILENASAQGFSEATVKNIYPLNGYSPVYGLKYIDTKDCTSWPNDSMAIYYGLNTVYGEK